MDFFLRHEDFNRSMFDLVQLLLERSGLGYSYYVFNQNNGKILERDLLSPDGDLSTNRKVYVSCL